RLRFRHDNFFLNARCWRRRVSCVRTFPYLMRVIQQGGDRCGSSWLMITGITKMPRTIWVTG
ncbi:hypothetical protein, partial [Xanthomonas euvesicatoria]|uniref:hypothetical protein n=1 Tax=Xanthomonas euvesicatoria TaxID=456327 RepID=UPI00240536F4